MRYRFRGSVRLHLRLTSDLPCALQLPQKAYMAKEEPLWRKGLLRHLGHLE